MDCDAAVVRAWLNWEIRLAVSRDSRAWFSEGVCASSRLAAAARSREPPAQSIFCIVCTEHEHELAQATQVYIWTPSPVERLRRRPHRPREGPAADVVDLLLH